MSSSQRFGLLPCFERGMGSGLRSDTRPCGGYRIHQFEAGAADSRRVGAGRRPEVGAQ